MPECDTKKSSTCRLPAVAGAYPIDSGDARTATAPSRDPHQSTYDRLSKPATSPSAHSPHDEFLQPKKLDSASAEKMVDRLYQQTLVLKEQRQKQNFDKVYKYEQPKKLTSKHLQQMADRMCSEEVVKRKQTAERLQEKYYHTAPLKPLTHEEVEESVNRLYLASMKHSEEEYKRLDDKYSFKPLHSKQVPPEVVAETSVRLSKPRACDWSAHPFFGATHGT